MVLAFCAYLFLYPHSQWSFLIDHMNFSTFMKNIKNLTNSRIIIENMYIYAKDQISFNISRIQV